MHRLKKHTLCISAALTVLNMHDAVSTLSYNLWQTRLIQTVERSLLIRTIINCNKVPPIMTTKIQV